MRSQDFAVLMQEARKFGVRLASYELGRPVFEIFGTIDRDRCKKEKKAFCGVRIVCGHNEVEMWYCVDKFGEVFASDDINEAFPFTRYPMPKEREENRKIIAKFAKELEDLLRDERAKKYHPAKRLVGSI